MTFYLIGLGLNERSLSLEALNILKKCEKIYLENYTVSFPYSKRKLGAIIGKKIDELNREEVEKEEFLDEAKKKDVALLIYGSPLTATTHISLILKCKEEKIRYKIIENASIFDAIAETGLQLYKFGKIASIPRQEANSFLKIVKDNKKINAHSLLLVDIGMELEEALSRLEEKEKVIICSCLGTSKKKIYYDKIEKLKEERIKEPFCIIIPGKMHFIEKETLEKIKDKV